MKTINDVSYDLHLEPFRYIVLTVFDQVATWIDQVAGNTPLPQLETSRVNMRLNRKTFCLPFAADVRRRRLLFIMV